MKTSIMVGTVGVLGIVMATSALGSELTAGYLNSKSREASIVLQDNAQKIQITNSAYKFYWGNAAYGSGKLFIVDSYGRIQVVHSTFRDRMGHTVALPVSNDDKVVVLNRYGNIEWAIGLEDAEIMALAPRDAQSLARVVVEAQNRPVFGALHYSSNILRNMRADADSIADMYLTSIRWMAGSDVELLVRRLMEKNSAGFLNGVSLVAQGGMGGGGGGGIVAQGGMGGGGGGGIVAQGGMGGGGGGGYNADVAVSLGSVTGINKLPVIHGLSAVAKGKIVVIQ